MRSTAIFGILISSASATDQWGKWASAACPNIAITATVRLQNVAGYKRDIAAPTEAPAPLFPRNEQGAGWGGGGWGGGGGPGGGGWGGGGWGSGGGGPWGGQGGHGGGWGPPGPPGPPGSPGPIPPGPPGPLPPGPPAVVTVPAPIPTCGAPGNPTCAGLVPVQGPRGPQGPPGPAGPPGPPGQNGATPVVVGSPPNPSGNCQKGMNGGLLPNNMGSMCCPGNTRPMMIGNTYGCCPCGCACTAPATQQLVPGNNQPGSPAPQPAPQPVPAPAPGCGPNCPLATTGVTGGAPTTWSMGAPTKTNWASSATSTLRPGGGAVVQTPPKGGPAVQTANIAPFHTAAALNFAAGLAVVGAMVL